ncbi:MAG TPA: cation:proton antiporter [Candidatus Acidoferrales bacterium]|jgi:CPA2 family monovalent cation:H+ antiporter-2|nr:cation:proton antiporter [Candidatus Acidoferrales bacterium]
MPSPDLSRTFIELGLAIVGLAVLARVATRLGFSSIPLYLIAGLAFGKGGLAPLHLSEHFIRIGAEIGVLLLLFMLGLEYSADELGKNLRLALPDGIADFVLNFTPGVAAGMLLGWSALASVLLGGVTWITSSGIVAKVLGDLGGMRNSETPVVLSILVFEDLAMALYLPIVGVLLIGGGKLKMAATVAIAVGVVILVLFVALRYGRRLSRLAAHQSEEVVLLTTFGMVLLVSGLAERFQVSAGIAAFLVGIALSGPMAEETRRLIAPLRDLFAATFFFFFGLEVDPATLPGAIPVALVLGVITGATKLLTGMVAARRRELDRKARVRAGALLLPRGEFSIVIAGLGAGFEPALAPLSAAYVLLLAIFGPFLVRMTK